jgi:hypothetical protein
MPEENVEQPETETEEQTDEVSEKFFPGDEPAEDAADPADEFDIVDPEDSAEDDDEDLEDIPNEESEDVPEDEPEEPAGEADPESAGQQVGISSELTARAGEVGLSSEDLDLFASPEAVEQYVSRREQQAGDAPPSPAQEEQAPYQVQLDSELYDDDIINEFSSLAKHLAGEMESVRAAHSQVLNHLDDEQQRAFISRVDARFASVPDELAEVFGTGILDDLDPSGPEMKARQEVVDMFNTISEKYPTDSEDTTWNRSLHALHGEMMTKLERTKIRSNIRKQRTLSHRPTQRESAANLTPEESAVAALSDKMAEF